MLDQMMRTEEGQERISRRVTQFFEKNPKLRELLQAGIEAYEMGSGLALALLGSIEELAFIEFSSVQEFSDLDETAKAHTSPYESLAQAAVCAIEREITCEGSTPLSSQQMSGLSYAKEITRFMAYRLTNDHDFTKRKRFIRL